MGRSLPLRRPGGAAQFFAIMLAVSAAVGIVFHAATAGAAGSGRHGHDLVRIFVALEGLTGVVAGLFVRSRARRCAADSETRRQIARLRQQVAEHVVTDAALRKARDAAEAANAAKTRYLASVSHEIRSPLNAICGYAQLLERGDDVPPAEAGTVIRQSAQHLTNLAEELLEISRIESGTVELRSDIVPIGTLLAQVVAMFSKQAAAKGLGLELVLRDRLPAYVRTDERRLRQILINLVSNAVKYTRQGGITLSVRYRNEVARIEVSDTGPGIAAAELDRIFEPFERGSGAQVRREPGIGLGLTITRVLTQLLGGDIAATSMPGTGSTFSLRIMLSAVHDMPGSAMSGFAAASGAGADAPADESPVCVLMSRPSMRIPRPPAQPARACAEGRGRVGLPRRGRDGEERMLAAAARGDLALRPAERDEGDP